MYAWLPDALSDDSEIVTANRRLARVLKACHGESRIAAGDKSWRTPPIAGWSDWLTRLLDSAVLDTSLPTRLSAQQCQVLWEQCIRSELRSPPANVNGLVRLAMDTWTRIHDWNVPFEECRKSAFGPDQRMFAGAAARYGAILANNNWIDDARRPGLLADLAGRQQLQLPRRLFLAGFDRIVPQAERLIGILTEQGVEVTRQPAEHLPADLSLAGFENSDAELRAAGAWAREQLEARRGASVAIVAGNLDDDAERTRRLVLEGLMPGWQFGDARQTAVLNVSYGRRLRCAGWSTICRLATSACSCDRRSSAARLLRAGPGSNCNFASCPTVVGHRLSCYAPCARARRTRMRWSSCAVFAGSMSNASRFRATALRPVGQRDLTATWRN